MTIADFPNGVPDSRMEEIRPDGTRLCWGLATNRGIACRMKSHLERVCPGASVEIVPWHPEFSGGNW